MNRFQLGRWILFLAVAAVARAQDGTDSRMPSITEFRDPPARLPIFYPPVAPAPAGAIDRVRVLQQPGWDAPPEAADFAGEIFYPLLATQLSERPLGRSLRERLERYRAQRSTLRDALLAEPRPSPTSAANESAVAALESEAEALRTALWNEDYNWDRYRRWRLVKSDEPIDPSLVLVREYQLLRAAAYYFPGLSLEQRRLLAELASTLGQGTGGLAKSAAPVATAGADVLFLPAGAAIRVPETIPGSLQRELQAFLVAKHRVQVEIARAVIATEDRGSPERALRKLAEDQAPTIVALERQAEALREQLAAVPASPAPALPAAVVTAAQEFSRRRAEFQRQLVEQLLERRRALCHYQPGAETLIWKATFHPGEQLALSGRKYFEEVAAYAVETPAQEQRVAKVTAELKTVVDRFLASHAAEQRAIEQERSRVLLLVVRALAPDTPSDAPAPETVNRAIRWLQTEEQRARLDPRSDYLVATLQPGLSPAQRRLLFNTAVTALHLPLPAGVRRPVFLFEAP